MSLRDVQHQGYAHRLIQRALARERVPHAYLFHGPSGVGKEAFGRAFARLLLCARPLVREGGSEGPIRDACGACDECRAVNAESHPDLHIVHRRLNREHPDADVRKRKGLELGVDVLRHFLIDRVGLTPVRNRAKVFIVRDADEITTQAQNAMLKTLEEPPGPTFIILLVSVLDRMLPTTLSRCQLLRFDALPPSFIEMMLTELVADLPADQAQWYARSSEGSLGWALAAVEDKLYQVNARLMEGLALMSSAPMAQFEQSHGATRPRSHEGKGRGMQSSGKDRDDCGVVKAVAQADAVAKLWMEESASLGERFRKRAPDISDTEASRRGLETIFRLAANWFADTLRVDRPDASALINAAWAAEAGKAASVLGPEKAADAIQRLSHAERQLDLNVNTQLCMECLLHDLALLPLRDEPASVHAVEYR